MKKKSVRREEEKKKKLDFSRKISFEPHLRVELAPGGLSDLFGRFP